MEEEEWRTVLEFWFYEVSNRGRVRSFVDPKNPGHILKPGRSKKGYLQVQLSSNAGYGMCVRRWCAVHILVLEAFVSPRPPGLLGLHWDGNNANNWVENLYWGTHSDNNRDAVRHGTHPMTKKIECNYGHRLDGRFPSGKRYCKTCVNTASRERKRARRAAQPPKPPTKYSPKLTPDQKEAIRQDPRPLRAIAADYGVSHTSVRRVKR